MRQWLQPDLTPKTRLRLVQEGIQAKGWKVRGWPRLAPKFLRKLSQVWPPLKTIVLADGHDVWSDEALLGKLGHEGEHMASAIEKGSYYFTWMYACGPLLATIALVLLVVAAGLDIGDVGASRWVGIAAFTSAVASIFMWKQSEDFRRADEVQAFAVSAAVLMVLVGAEHTHNQAKKHFGAQTLHGWAYPYLVGGGYYALVDDVAQRTLEVLS